MKLLARLIVVVLFVASLVVADCYLFGKTIIYKFPPLPDGAVVGVIQEGRRFSFLNIHNRYLLKISYDAEGIYGHSVDLSIFHEDDRELANYLRKCQLREDSLGITFSQPSGHSTFIPVRAYSGGR